MKIIITRSASELVVDNSKEAFERAGFGKFSSGQTVFDPNGYKCVLEGMEGGFMWYTLEGEAESVYYYPCQPSDFTAINHS